MFGFISKRNAYQQQQNTALKLAAGDKYAQQLERSLGISKAEDGQGEHMDEQARQAISTIQGLIAQLKEQVEIMAEYSVVDDEHPAWDAFTRFESSLGSLEVDFKDIQANFKP